MKRTAFLLAVILGASAVAEAQTTIYLKRDHIYAGPGGSEIAIVSPASSDTTAPSAPSSLGTTSTTATSVALEWTGSSDSGGSGLAGYKIYRAKTSGGASLPVGTVNSSSTEFTDQGPLEPNTGYTYAVVAFDAAQNHSSASNNVTPTTSTAAGDTTAPTVPGGFTGWLIPRNSIGLAWNASADVGGSGIQGYKVYQDGTLVSGSTPITARSFTQTGLAYETAYSYKVEAIDNANNVSAQTSAVNVTTGLELFWQDGFNRADASSLGTEWSYLSGSLGSSVPLRLGGAGADAPAPTSAGNITYISLANTTSWDTFRVSVDVDPNPFLAGLILYAHEENSVIHAYRIAVSANDSNMVTVDKCTNLLGACTNVGNAPNLGTLSVRAFASAGAIVVNGSYVELEQAKMYGGTGLYALSLNASGNIYSAHFDNFIIESNN